MNPFRKESKQLSIFITAGYPRINSLPEQILLLQKNNIDFIEVGIPFSDPLADGIIIQESSKIALANGMKLELIFEQLNEIKEKITVPIVLMGYVNPILRFGMDAFLKKAAHCGISGLIIPDLPYDIYARNYKKTLEASSIPYIPLITPLSNDDHIRKVARDCENGFIYLVSQNATTGQNIALNLSSDRYTHIRKLCGNTPLFIGFGIKNRADVDRVNSFCDGAIIGSAFIQSLAEKEETTFLKNLKL
jgi:tryptophan synthase alpha chain